MLYKKKRIFEVKTTDADSYRRDYVKGIESYIECRCAAARNERYKLITSGDFKENQVQYRKMYLGMLGADKILSEPTGEVERVFVCDDEVCKIFRLKVYITPEIPMYAMLLLPHNVKAPVPLVVAQHGGGGTPESCSDFDGKNNYNHMVQRVLERGAAVIAPQLLLWSQSESEAIRAHNVPYNRQQIDSKLKRLGLSMTGLEVAGIIRCIDYASSLPEIDSESVGMIGLSYGGYFTLHTMAADERIKVGYSAGCFNDRDVYDWSDWCYNGSALSFQDAEVMALCAPRPIYVSVGCADEVFDYKYAIPEAHRAKEYYALLGCGENFRFSVWSGGHTVEDGDEGYDFLFDVLKGDKKCTE